MSRLPIMVGVLAPLAIDTFVLGAALGLLGLTPRDRLRVSLVMAAFEGAMPVVGFFIGGFLGGLLGGYAGYAGVAFLLVAGALMLWPGDEEAEERRIKLLSNARGPAVIYLGLSVSIDELTIGFSLGLLGISIVVAVAWIVVQALVASQVGMRLGSRIGEKLRERAEQLAGLVLVAMALALLVLKIAA